MRINSCQLFQVILPLVILLNFSVYAQELTAGKGDYSSIIKLELKSKTDNPITAIEQEYYFVIINSGSKEFPVRLHAESNSCAESFKETTDINPFQVEILSSDRQKVNGLNVGARSSQEFLVKITRLNITQTTWGCIEIVATASDKEKSHSTSYSIKQLNPGASNFK